MLNRFAALWARFLITSKFEKSTPCLNSYSTPGFNADQSIDVWVGIAGFLELGPGAECLRDLLMRERYTAYTRSIKPVCAKLCVVALHEDRKSFSDKDL